MSKIDTMNRLWRPFGAWGLAINLTALPWAIYFMALLGMGESHIPALIGLVATLGGWFVGLFAARQIGKNKQMEVESEVEIARINDDDEIITPN